MKKEEFKLTFCKAEAPTSDYTQVPNALWSDKRLTNADIRVLGYLLSHADGFKANKTFLAKGLDMDRSYFGRRFNYLKKLGVISETIDTLTFNMDMESWTICPIISRTQSPSETIVQDKLDSVSKTSGTIVQDKLDYSPTNNIIQEEVQKEKQKELQVVDNIVSDVIPESKIESLFFLDDNFQKVINLYQDFKHLISFQKFEKIILYFVYDYSKCNNSVTIYDNKQLQEVMSYITIKSLTKEMFDGLIQDMLLEVNLVKAITAKLKINSNE